MEESSHLQPLGAELGARNLGSLVHGLAAAGEARRVWSVLG